MTRYGITLSFTKVPDILFDAISSVDDYMWKRFGRMVMRNSDVDPTYTDRDGVVYGHAHIVDSVLPTFEYDTFVLITEYVPKYTMDAWGHLARGAPNVSEYNGMNGWVKKTYWYKGEEIAKVKLDIPRWRAQEPEWMLQHIAVSKLSEVVKT